MSRGYLLSGLQGMGGRILGDVYVCVVYRQHGDVGEAHMASGCSGNCLKACGGLPSCWLQVCVLMGYQPKQGQPVTECAWLVIGCLKLLRACIVWWRATEVYLGMMLFALLGRPAGGGYVP